MLCLREKDFVSASVVSGEGVSRIVFSEILPNMLSLVMSSLFGAVIYTIGADAGLAFLGFENVNIVSWGTMLYWASNSSALLQEAWWTFLPPGLCIALVSFATTMLIYAMDEVTNPRLRSEKEITRVLRKYHIGANRSTPVVKEPLAEKPSVGYPGSARGLPDHARAGQSGRWRVYCYSAGRGCRSGRRIRQW
jgi:peptide/nickel transport system permease protein